MLETPITHEGTINMADEYQYIAADLQKSLEQATADRDNWKLKAAMWEDIATKLAASIKHCLATDTCTLEIVALQEYEKIKNV
jgi:hypothetical protein